MRSIHTEQDIETTCEELCATHGTRTTRPHVQDALKRRAERLGAGPVGADNATVGRILRMVVERRRLARTADLAAEAADANAGEVPQRVAELIEQFRQTLTASLAGIVQEVQRQAEGVAVGRIQAAERVALMRVAEMRAETDATHEEMETLTGDHQRALEELDEANSQIATLTASLQACRSESLAHRTDLTRHLLDLQNEVGELKSELGKARSEIGRLTSSQLQLDALRIRAEERHAAAEQSRDEYREEMRRLQARLRDAERVAEERRVRLELVAAGDDRPLGSTDDGARVPAVMPLHS